MLTNPSPTPHCERFGIFPNLINLCSIMTCKITLTDSPKEVSVSPDS